MADMLKGTTTSGFEFEIPFKRTQNYELVEAIAEEESNPLVIPKIVNLLLGEQAKDLKEHLRDEDGIVDLTKMTEEVKEIFQTQPLKN